LTRDFPSVRAVDDLTLEVPAGIVFGFLGPNGSGKTTTIRLLLGLLEATKGRAEVLGFDTRAQSGEIRARSGVLLEHSGLYERLSALDNLEFYGRVWHIPPDRRRARIKELLTHLGLWERRREPVGGWSRGMKQKLAVARTLLHEPDLVFLDEPTAGLDPVAAAALREDLAGLVAREGVTVFLNTHNLSEAEKLCELVGVIREGRLVSVGHPDDIRSSAGGARMEVLGRGLTDSVIDALRTRPEVASARLAGRRLVVDLREGSASGTLVTFLVGQGVEIEEIRKGKASLEEAFLAMMEEEQP